MFDAPHKQSAAEATPAGGESSQPAQRRSARRCAFVASAEVTELASQARLAVRTSELGVGGCYIDTLNPFPEGTPVQVRILRDNGVFDAKAKVVYSHAGFGMGLAFTEIPPDQLAILESWVAEVVIQLRANP